MASEVAPDAVLNFPAAHSVQNVVVPLDHEPVPHNEHVEAPVPSSADPAAHEAQTPVLTIAKISHSLTILPKPHGFREREVHPEGHGESIAQVEKQSEV